MASTSARTKRTKKAAQAPSRPHPPPSGVILPFEDTEHQHAYDTLSSQHVKWEPTRWIHWGDMAALGLHSEMRRLAGPVRLCHFVDVCEPSYQNLTMKFPSTLTVELDPHNWKGNGTLRFCLGNEWRKFSICDLNRLFRYPESGAQHLGGQDCADFWYRVSGRNDYDNHSKASQIVNPVF